MVMAVPSQSSLHAVDSGAVLEPVDGLKFLIVDDHYLVRDGLRLALRQIDPNAHVLEGETTAQGIEAYRLHRDIDLVLLDLNMPGSAGLESLEAFYAQCPDARLVVISASYDMQTVQAAVTRGVLGFIPKMSGSADLLNALKFVLGGGIYVPRETFFEEGPATSAATEPPRASPSASSRTPQQAGLTVRQIDVLQLLLEGKSNKQICRDLDLALGTVKSHVAAILQTLDAATRAQAVAAVERLGWREDLSKKASVG